MYPFISLGPIALPTKAVIYILGVWFGLAILEKTAAHLAQNWATLYSLATNALLIGLVGARTVFVLLHWQIYAANLLSIFWPLNTGYDVWGGLITGGVYFFFMMRAKQLDYGQTADVLTPCLLILFFAIFLADYLAGPGYGAATGWSNLSFHPVQLYEIAVILVAGLVWWAAHQRPLFAGYSFLLTAAVVAFGLLLTTPFHGNAWITSSGWYLAQFIYLFVTILCLLTIIYFTTKYKQDK